MWAFLFSGLISLWKKNLKSFARKYFMLQKKISKEVNNKNQGASWAKLNPSSEIIIAAETSHNKYKVE
jgi:hypothetical protein